MGTEVQRLERFVEKALERGVPKNEIEQALRQAGWSAEQTKKILASFADISFSIPVPTPQISLSARDAFLYLLMFSSLYFWTWNLGDLLFSVINNLIPDISSPSWQSWIWNQQRWSTASVIIALPLFLFIARFIQREIVKDPIKRLSSVRRGLTYLTLFIAAVTLIGDTTTLVYKLLGGETTLRFVLKIGVVALIAGSAFWYYLNDLRKDENA